ncbi:MAG: DUF4340 domain-containing protein [Verrucomicrobiota bacterium]
MRSLAATLVLVLVTLVVGGLGVWRLVDGNFSAMLGDLPPPPGQRLYASFTPEAVQRIQVSAQGVNAEFVKSASGWQMLQPWQDRMDPRAAIGIIGFTLGMRVEDLAPVEKVRMAETGLADEFIFLRLEGRKGSLLAKYRLGHHTSWQATDPETSEPVPTLFVQPWERNRRTHVFACTGDILSLFKNNLKFLRDHHPFYFHPSTLQKIRIRSTEGELTLGRATAKEPWHIIKPLDLRTDPAAIKALIEGLHNLQAVTVKDRAAVTLPAPAAGTATKQIALTVAGEETEIVLDIYPPETPEASDVLATISDRPNTVFSLPRKPERNLVSLADLPLAVNDLRDATLTNLNIASLQAVSIQPATGPEIFLTREGPKLWTTLLDGSPSQANELRLFELLKAVTNERVIGFESDAATDFSPWGLQRPFLKLNFISQDSRTLTLRFGMDKSGNLFVNRLGTASVMRIDRSLLSAIAIHAFEWRHARLWSLSRADLVGITRGTPGQAPLKLAYDYLDESWKAELAGKDVSDAINPDRANFLLGAVESLEVTRWLAPAAEEAKAALAKPMLTLEIEERIVNELSEVTGVKRHELKFAPVPGASPPRFYYGSQAVDPHPFLLDSATFEKLAVDLRGNK